MPWFIARLLWTQCLLLPLAFASIWFVTKLVVFCILILLGPFLTVYHHPLGYDSYRFSFFLTGYQCSLSVTRRCQLPRNATLANGYFICNIWHFRDRCAMFLNFSLLEAVRHFCFHLEVCRSNHTVMLRSQNNYITSVLILFMLASVCQSNSRSVVGTNTNYAAGEFCGGISIWSGAHGLC
jgi:hypothetical protein